MGLGAKQGIAISFCIVRAILFGFSTGLAFFVAPASTADVAEGTAWGIEAITAPGDNGAGMSADFPGDGRGGTVKPAGNVADGTALPEQCFDAGAVIRRHVRLFFHLHKNSFPE